MLTRDEILSRTALRKEAVNVPEWGGVVYVSELTARDRDGFEQSVVEGKRMNLDNFRARFAVRTIVGEDGKRLFSDDDAASLGQTSAAALERVYEVAQRLNAMGKKDAEELVKNSGTGPCAGLPSA